MGWLPLLQALLIPSSPGFRSLQTLSSWYNYVFQEKKYKQDKLKKHYADYKEKTQELRLGAETPSYPG